MKRKRKPAPIVTVFLIVAVGVLLILAEMRVSNVRNELMSYAARNAASAAATVGIEKSLETDRVRYADLIKFGRDGNGNIVSKTPYTNVTSSDLTTATQGTATVCDYTTRLT